MYTRALPKGLNIIVENGETKVFLYSTIIVRIHLNTIILNNGGWATPHTKKCMNLVLAKTGYSVFQKAGIWYVRHNGKDMLYTNFMKLNMHQKEVAS